MLLLHSMGGDARSWHCRPTYTVTDAPEAQGLNAAPRRASGRLSGEAAGASAAEAAYTVSRCCSPIAGLVRHACCRQAAAHRDSTLLHKAGERWNSDCLSHPLCSPLVCWGGREARACSMRRVRHEGRFCGAGQWGSWQGGTYVGGHSGACSDTVRRLRAVLSWICYLWLKPDICPQD